MFNRWAENGLLTTLDDLGVGYVAFSPLAQGLLTDKYLGGVPEGSRAARDGSMQRSSINEKVLTSTRGLNEIAQSRGQSLAQLALSWALRDSMVTTLLVGASSVEQLKDSLACTSRLDFEDEELERIDEYAIDMGVNVWAKSSSVYATLR